MKQKIAFQGTYGANSHIACLNLYPNMEPVPYVTFREALQSVENGQSDLVMIPIENTVAGRVADMHSLLPDAKLFIIGEYFLPIHFQLMTLKENTLKDIKTVHSHIHALSQCQKIIEKNHWQPIVTYDTAGAAKLLNEQQTPFAAVLAPKIAASIYNLKIIAENVEDEKTNITRFIILSKHYKIPPLNSEKKQIITTLIFRVRNVPAALYKVLGGFATNGINMTKLESYQLNASFRATQFLADIEAHIEEPSVQLALEELKFFSEKINILGVYPAAKHRHSSKIDYSGVNR